MFKMAPYPVSCFVSMVTGIVLDMGKSLHNQGIMEQEHIQLTFDPIVSPDAVVLQLSENACTEGAITRSESVGSEVRERNQRVKQGGQKLVYNGILSLFIRNTNIIGKVSFL